MIIPFSPMDVIANSKETNVPNFKRIDDARICYCCKFSKYDFKRYGILKTFYCSKFDFPFGENGVMMAEFSCDDWEQDIYL